MKYTCPVCGFPELDFDPVRDRQEICWCCSIQFGYDDFNRSHEELRQEWINNGCVWWCKREGPPEGWNAQEQLARLTQESEQPQ